MALAVVLAAASTSTARADGLTTLVDFGYGANEIDRADQSGLTQHFRSGQVRQRYRLALNRSFFPTLTFSGGGIFELSHTAPSLLLRDARRGPRNTSLFGTLSLTGTLFNGSLGYVRQSRELSAGATDFVTELPALTLNWAPTDLPQWSFRIARPATFDAERAVQDRYSEDLLLTGVWRPLKPLDLQYSGGLSHPIDRLRETESVTGLHIGRVSWAQPLFGGTTTAAANLNASYRNTRVIRSGPDAALITPLFPAAGLSAVETFPATATQIELANNPALIDGNTTSSAGIDLGFRVRLDGDLRARHLGAQFTDITIRTNGAYIWLDRALPAVISQAIRWTIYVSRDNRTWTALSSTPTVEFSPFFPRFELRFEPITEPYVKFVAMPLDPAVTNQGDYEHLAVTELQLLQLEAVPQDGSSDETLQASLNATAQTRITPELSHDITTLLSASRGTQQRTTGAYVVTNGLSYTRPLAPWLLGSARVSHTDRSNSGVHRMLFGYSAALAASPLPTLGVNVAYGGQTSYESDRWNNNHSISLTGRATPYRGVNLAGNAALSLGFGLAGQWTLGQVYALGAQVAPHPRVTLGASAAHSGARTYSPRAPTQSIGTTRYDASANFAPFPALYVAASIGYTVMDVRSSPSGSLSLGFSPFPGGALQLSLVASQSLDPTGSIIRMLAPSLRWNIRRGVVLSASYSYFDNPNGVPFQTTSRGLAANLQVVL